MYLDLCSLNTGNIGTTIELDPATENIDALLLAAEAFVNSDQSFPINAGFIVIQVQAIPQSFKVVYPDSKWFDKYIILIYQYMCTRTVIPYYLDYLLIFDNGILFIF
jgi:hypothetical protein